MSYDTTTIRPGWHGETTTIIKTKHVTASNTSRKTRLIVIATAAVATVVAAAVSFGFLVPSATQAPLDPNLAAADAAREIGNTDVNVGLAQNANAASTIEQVNVAAADALAADTQVKAQLALAKQTAVSAGQVGLAEAKAAWAKAMKTAGTSAYKWANAGSGAPVPVPDGAFIWPTKYTYISSPFGWRTDPVYGGSEFHTGVDLATPCGTPIYASGDGIVSYSGWNGSYGNYIEINHGQLSTGYGHQSKLVAKVGDHVSQGDLIGYVGSTGKSTGCHVHFLAINGKGQYFDPTTLIH